MSETTEKTDKQAKPKPAQDEARRKVYRIDVRTIVENHNPRNPLPVCLQSRYSTFTGRPGDLWALAVCDDAEKGAEFVRIMGEDDEFVLWAQTFLTQGQLEPVELRDNGTKKGASNTYTIIFGARRCLAAAYNAWATGKKANFMVDAYLAPKLNKAGLLHRSIVENQRSDPNPIEMANAILMCLNQQETIEEIAQKQGRSTTWVKTMLALLELPPARQKRVAAGTLSIKKALAQQQEDNGHVPRERLGVKKRMEAALAPLVESFSVFSQLLETPDTDDDYEVSVSLTIGQMRSIKALLAKPAKKGKDDGARDAEAKTSEEASSSQSHADTEAAPA